MEAIVEGYNLTNTKAYRIILSGVQDTMSRPDNVRYFANVRFSYYANVAIRPMSDGNIKERYIVPVSTNNVPNETFIEFFSCKSG